MTNQCLTGIDSAQDSDALELEGSGALLGKWAPSISILVALALLGFAGSAGAVGYALTPLGGSATGVVGDTLVVGLDLTLDEGEYVTIAAAGLTWDLEGGNILDATYAFESSTQIGTYTLNPLVADTWSTYDATATTSEDFLLTDQRWNGTNTLTDNRVGPTLFYGFEQTSTVLDENGVFQTILTDGVVGAGTYRVGTIEFLLQSVGTTEINFYTEPNGFRTFFTGSEAVFFSEDQIELTPLTVSSGSLASLAINVVPEPGTALLLGLGLFGLATTRPRR